MEASYHLILSVTDGSVQYTLCLNGGAVVALCIP